MQFKPTPNGFALEGISNRALARIFSVIELYQISLEGITPKIEQEFDQQIAMARNIEEASYNELNEEIELITPEDLLQGKAIIAPHLTAFSNHFKGLPHQIEYQINGILPGEVVALQAALSGAKRVFFDILNGGVFAEGFRNKPEVFGSYPAMLGEQDPARFWNAELRFLEDLERQIAPYLKDCTQSIL